MSISSTIQYPLTLSYLNINHSQINTLTRAYLRRMVVVLSGIMVAIERLPRLLHMDDTVSINN